MEKIKWFDRQFNFEMPPGMLPFFIERMEGTLPRLKDKVAGVPDKILSDKLDGKWSIKQNIGHLSEVEEISLKRLPEILNGISPMSPAVFEPSLDYNAMPVEEVIELFAKTRKRNLTQYKDLDFDDLTRRSLHPRLKVLMNPVDLALFHAEHDDHHLVRINDILIHFNYRYPYVSSYTTTTD